MAKPDELLQSVQEILLKEWDPIGVNHHEECKDEYDSYAPTICRYLKEGVSEAKLATHLGQIRCEAMGLSHHDDEGDRVVARRLLSLLRSE